MYIGLWSRLDGFERDHLTRALERRDRRAGAPCCARPSISSRASDYWPFAVAIREPRRANWLRYRGEPSAAEGDEGCRARRGCGERSQAGQMRAQAS